MLAFAAFLLAAQPAPAAPVPDQAMLDSLRAACERIADIDAVRAAIPRAGFEPVAETADPRLAQVNQAFRNFAGSEGRLTTANFRTTIGARTLYLYLSRWDGNRGSRGNSCRLHDFEADAPLDAQTLERWMGRSPSQVQDQGEMGVMRVWEPAWGDDTMLQAIHIPQWRRAEEPGITGNVVGISFYVER